MTGPVAERGQEPTCEASDGDVLRMRVCACQKKNAVLNAPAREQCPKSRQDCACLENLWHVLFGEPPVLPPHRIYDQTRFRSTRGCADPRLSMQAREKLNSMLNVPGFLPQVPYTGLVNLPARWQGNYRLCGKAACV